MHPGLPDTFTAKCDGPRKTRTFVQLVFHLSDRTHCQRYDPPADNTYQKVIVFMRSLAELIETISYSQSSHAIELLRFYQSSSLAMNQCLLWPPCVADVDIIFLPCGFFLSIFYLFFYSSPNLSGCTLDIYHTSTHGVALVRI